MPASDTFCGFYDGEAKDVVVGVYSVHGFILIFIFFVGRGERIEDSLYDGCLSGCFETVDHEVSTGGALSLHLNQLLLFFLGWGLEMGVRKEALLKRGFGGLCMEGGN